MDELLIKLRNLGIGCHIRGVFFGAALYADDLVLLDPSRNALQKMLDLCEEYAVEHTLVFSTDPNPDLSKTKCLYMVGKVTRANHLGHTLH